MSSHEIPRSIGVIIDGNRRWAKERGYPSLVGHKAGYQKVKETLGWAAEAGVSFVTIYAFSTENWNRSTEEVNYLMGLVRLLDADIQEFKSKGYRLRVIGDLSRMPHDIQELLKRAESETAGGEKLTIACALSYGGQDEIVAAVNAILTDKGRTKGPVTKEELFKYMWSHDIPFPDLVIRTGGDQRLSNFLTWQTTYSELFFIKDFWPSFTHEQFTHVLHDYGERQRRFGK